MVRRYQIYQLEPCQDSGTSGKKVRKISLKTVRLRHFKGCFVLNMKSKEVFLVCF